MSLRQGSSSSNLRRPSAVNGGEASTAYARGMASTPAGIDGSIDTDLPTLSITMLGAGQEVGRSCCVLKHRGKTVVCDVGLHPANEGLAALPFIDELDWSTVDAILITHFHVDHAAGLPYVMEKTNFKQGKGKVYMTHPTKAIFRLTMQDAVRIGGIGDRSGARSDADANAASSSNQLYTEADLDLAWQNIIAVDYHQDIVVSGGLRFTPYHAGHVLGAAMFMIEIAGINVLYTGDYSREEDRHLVAAEVPNIRPDVMICESTFGVHTLPPRRDKEEHFTTLVSNIVKRGGRCLLPIGAFGNVQELLLILDEYWAAHPELHNVPIYYASGLAHRGMQVYRTYIHTMNSSIRSRFSKDRNDNPFAFRYVRNIKDFNRWEDKGPCVMMATPQMLQGYQSRELLEKWAPDRKNGLVITGYSIEGTMAKVLVHGEASVMGRLRAALQSQFAETDIKIHTPRNVEELQLTFHTERVVKVIGSLAAKQPRNNDLLSGLLVQKDFSYTMLDPNELKDFTGLGTTEILQKQNIRTGVSWEMIRWHLEGMYGEIMDSVSIIQKSEQELQLIWSANASSDMIADSALAVISGIDYNFATIKMTSKSHDHDHGHEHAAAHPHVRPKEGQTKALAGAGLADDVNRLRTFLLAHFEDVSEVVTEETPGKEDELLIIEVKLDDDSAKIDLVTMTVTATNPHLRNRVVSILEMALSTITSLTRTFQQTPSAHMVVKTEEIAARN